MKNILRALIHWLETMTNRRRALILWVLLGMALLDDLLHAGELVK